MALVKVRRLRRGLYALGPLRLIRTGWKHWSVVEVLDEGTDKETLIDCYRTYAEAKTDAIKILTEMASE